jgi:hypothetical protein
MNEKENIRARVLVVPLDEPIDPFWTTSDAIEHEGVFLQSTQLLPADSSCLLKILFGDQDLWLRANVVHHIPGVGFGCKFIEVGLGKRELLSTWLVDEATLSPVVERRPRTHTPC